jgi:hypothetical protein
MAATVLCSFQTIPAFQARARLQPGIEHVVRISLYSM